MSMYFKYKLRYLSVLCLCLLFSQESINKLGTWDINENFTKVNLQNK